MAFTLRITDQSGSGKVGSTTDIPGISTGITLRDLIRTRVREEVARHNSEKTQLFRGLVMPEGAEATAEGYVLPQPRRIDWEKQADRAIESFGRNGFFVLVDGRQVTELDEELSLTADSDVRFVRLVQLVGG